METLELHILAEGTNYQKTIKRLAIVELGGRGLLVEFYSLVGSYLSFCEEFDHIMLGKELYFYSEKIEGTMENGQWTAYSIDPADAALIAETLDKHLWAIEDGDYHICQNWKQGLPLTNRVIYSA
jgi:hypothetical protein